MMDRGCSFLGIRGNIDMSRMSCICPLNTLQRNKYSMLTLQPWLRSLPRILRARLKPSCPPSSGSVFVRLLSQWCRYRAYQSRVLSTFPFLLLTGYLCQDSLSKNPLSFILPTFGSWLVPFYFDPPPPPRGASAPSAATREGALALILFLPDAFGARFESVLADVGLISYLIV